MPGPVHAPLAVSPWSPTELPPRSSTQPRVTVFPPPTKTRNRVKFVSRHRLLRPIIYLPPLELHANETLRYFLTETLLFQNTLFLSFSFCPEFLRRMYKFVSRSGGANTTKRKGRMIVAGENTLSEGGFWEGDSR